MSIEFFRPIYDELLINGFSEDDIHWGIKESREYVINDVKNEKVYFYDFTIKSKKIIIEFNGLYWHPRLMEEWRGMGDYETLKDRFDLKINAATEREFKVIIVWEDENWEFKRKEIIDAIIGR